MKRILYSNLFSSVAITLTIFILFFLLCKPIVNADDDFYFLYTLSGGFGDSPSNLLHYNYAWNPILTWPIVELFKHFPKFNWYTFTLLSFHFASCVNLLYCLFTIFKKPFAINVFLSFFIFVESRLLLSLHYSHASIITAISGCTSLLVFYLPDKNKTRHRLNCIASSIILLIIAGLLRIHTTGLYMALTLCLGLFLLPFHLYRKLALNLFLVSAFLFIALQAHKYYYEIKIPNWQTDESFRQSMFDIINHPIKKNLNNDAGLVRVKNSFIQNLFIYDSSFIKNDDLKNYYQPKVYIRSGEERHAILYWTFIESRIYLLLLSAFALFLLLSRQYKIFVNWSIFFVISILFFLYLMFFQKVTEGIFLSLFSANFFYAIFLTKDARFGKNLIFALSCLLFFLSCLWMILRIYHFNEANIAKINKTKCLFKELNDHPSLLFVSTANDIPIKGFYVWDSPEKYAVRNLIDKGFVLNKCYKNTLTRFGINNLMRDLPAKANIILIGNTLPLLKEYYLTMNLRIEINKLQESNCLNLYQIHQSTLLQH